MSTTIDTSSEEDRSALRAAARAFRDARCPVALSGAGVSVESGIPDFRSPGGLWERYPAEDYASIQGFLENPARSWILFREMGETIARAEPNPAHQALGDLENRTHLSGVVTQNIDGLHQAGGSKNVLEIHGNYLHLHCLSCASLSQATEELLLSGEPPCCDVCGAVLKPNVVLFGEAVQSLGPIQELMSGCDLLIVVGTSAQIYPAAALPLWVRQTGGAIFEFNLEQTHLTREFGGADDAYFPGPAGETLPRFTEAVLALPER